MPPSWNLQPTHSYPFLVVLGRSSKREIYGGFSLCLLRELLNWTFICVIEKTKGVKQSFIIESEQKSFVVEQLNHPKGNTKTKGLPGEKTTNEQIFTYNSHPKLLLYCWAASNLYCLQHTQVARSDVVAQCLDMINDSL
jgi:hypothetical protein